MNFTNGGATEQAPDAAGFSPRGPRKLTDTQKTITMAQIAKAAGVSQGAISSLLNDRDYGIRVSEKTRERVFKVCRELGYIPNDLRAVVRMYPELGEFCLLISSKMDGGLNDPFVARLAHSAMAAIPDGAHALTLAFYDERMDYLENPDALPEPVQSGVASKFICLGGPNPSLLQALTRRGVPVVAVGHDASLPGVLSLMPDYHQASCAAIRHLLELGHRHVGIVSGPFGSTDPQIIELNRGVKMAFDDFGIPIEAQNIVYGDLSFKAGVAAVSELLAHTHEPTAVFCVADIVAAGVLAEAQNRGLKVPADLSVIGCADDGCAQYLHPSLTTIHLPAEEMADLAVKELDRMIRQGVTTEPGKRILPVRLVERESTAPPKDSAAPKQS